MYDRLSNSRFPSASGAVEPEDPLNANDSLDNPGAYLLENGLARVGVALGYIVVVFGVKGGGGDVFMKVLKAVCKFFNRSRQDHQDRFCAHVLRLLCELHAVTGISVLFLIPMLTDVATGTGGIAERWGVG